MYTYGQLMLMYGRNETNIVRQLSFNYKLKKRTVLNSSNQSVRQKLVWNLGDVCTEDNIPYLFIWEGG